MSAPAPGQLSRMLDRAYWDPELVLAAQRYGANAIAGYAFDRYVNDVGGWCGGWTPAAAAAVRAGGLHFVPIFTFRDGDQQPSPARCVELVKQLGAVAGDWVVASDTETGAMPSSGYVRSVVDALEAAAFCVLVYGNARTLAAGYLADVEAPWVASYLASGPDPAPQLATMPNVGEWQLAAWQYTDRGLMNGIDFDLSVHNLAWGSAPAPDPPPPPAEDFDVPSPLISSRPQGGVDIFSVLPAAGGNTAARHVFLPSAGAAPEYNDALPGSWSDFTNVVYNSDGSIDLYGHGWQSGQGGGLDKVSWTQANGWAGPWAVL